MTMLVHSDPVPLRLDETGTIRVSQSRVTLDVLLADHRNGNSPEEIARQLDTLSLADVYGALAYYYRHQAEVDEYLRQRQEQAEQLRRQIEANQPERASLKARLQERLAGRNAGHASTAE